jgi:hypothetical protein
LARPAPLSLASFFSCRRFLLFRRREQEIQSVEQMKTNRGSLIKIKGDINSSLYIFVLFAGACRRPPFADQPLKSETESGRQGNSRDVS